MTAGEAKAWPGGGGVGARVGTSGWVCCTAFGVIYPGFLACMAGKIESWVECLVFYFLNGCIVRTERCL